MKSPNIKTAIPKRRYVIGEFNAVLLADIESGDANRYQYVFAAVRSGDAKPLMYVISERAPRAQRDRGSHLLRVITGNADKQLDVSDRWRDEEDFTVRAIELVATTLMLTDEPVARVL